MASEAAYENQSCKRKKYRELSSRAKQADDYLSNLVCFRFKRIRETGIRSAINRRHQTPKPRCAGHVSSFSSVGADELKPVLTLMAIGVALSLATLCVEILTYRL